MASATGDTATKRADNNRERRLAAHKALDELLALAAAPDFSGSVTIQVNSHEGLFGRMKKSTDHYVS